jgi:N-acetylmuramoyl-L-alanine amidase
MNPVKYYADFLTLNEKNIRNGSELIVGATYVLPDAPDSFKNMGTRIDVVKSKEQPIFDSALGEMRLKDSTLYNSVYHLMYTKESRPSEHAGSTPDFMERLANDLLVRGAKVYIYEKKILENAGEAEEDSIALKKKEFGTYISAINKRYLMNNGRYQRLLLVQERSTDKKVSGVSVHHFETSLDGKNLAGNLRDIFRKNWKGTVINDEETPPLHNEATNYFANNVLPSLTTIDLNFDGSKNEVKIKSIQTDIAELITSGILKDYSNTHFSD